MPRLPPAPLTLSKAMARRIWLHAQRLDQATPFGSGPQAVPAAVAHLGYVQIDTINVIERCHHHILWNRIPEYRRADLQSAQSVSKSVFEYWTHALAYVPSADFPVFMPAMKQQRRASRQWFGTVTKADIARVLARIRDDGPLTIRDIEDDVLVEKTHAWGSRKPSKRALQFAFYTGDLTISARAGMLKTYELTDRHFGWTTPPPAATERQVLDYGIDRALRAQGLVSLDSICHLEPSRKPAVHRLLEGRVRRKALRAVMIEGVKAEHWAPPGLLDETTATTPDLIHILSPFDPLIIQRKRLAQLFDYDHRFEAYVPKAKRVFGYFALPVVVGDAVVAVIDMKADRAARTLLVQQWTWTAPDNARLKPAIEAALHRFERFQLQD